MRIRQSLSESSVVVHKWAKGGDCTVYLSLLCSFLVSQDNQRQAREIEFFAKKNLRGSVRVGGYLKLMDRPHSRGSDAKFHLRG
jgi:hypothetical protein